MEAWLAFKKQSAACLTLNKSIKYLPTGSIRRDLRDSLNSILEDSTFYVMSPSNAKCKQSGEGIRRLTDSLSRAPDGKFLVAMYLSATCRLDCEQYIDQLVRNIKSL